MAAISAIIAVLTALWVVGWVIHQAKQPNPNPWAIGLTKQQRAYIRRRSRETGLPEAEVHKAWEAKRVEREQKAATAPLLDMAPPDDVEALVFDLEMNVVNLGPSDEPGIFNLNVEFHCRKCGGYVIHIPGDETTDDSPAMCKACGTYFGTFGAVRAMARDKGRAALKQTS